jgi:hypothetical protein
MLPVIEPPTRDPTSKSGAPDAPEAPDEVGGPWRTRTSDPLIKSQLLYQLS